MYGASLSAEVGKTGERQILSCSIVGIDDRFALEGESVSAGCARLLGEILLAPNITQGAFPMTTFTRKNFILRPGTPGSGSGTLPTEKSA